MKFINGMVSILLCCLNSLYAQDTIHLNAQDLHAQNLEAKDTTQKIKVYL